MAPEILDGTANCSSPFMSPCVCLSGERRHASVSDVAQVAKTAGCRIHHTISTAACSEINLCRRRHCRFHLTPLGEDVLFFCFYLFFLIYVQRSYKQLLLCLVFAESQLHSFFTEEHSRENVCIQGHA